MNHIIRFVNEVFNRIGKRNLHSTLKYNVRIVNPYLLDRSIPASEKLKSLNDEDSKLLEKIKSRCDYLQANSTLVPRSLTDENYLDLLCLTKIQGLNYLRKLAHHERSRINKSDKPKPPLNDNSENEHFISNRFYSKFIRSDLLIENRLCQAFILDSQELVLDFSYESLMNINNINHLAHELLQVYNWNKTSKDPFKIVCSNVKRGSLTYYKLNEFFKKHISKNLEDLHMIISDKGYSDLFPDKRLVYLSPSSSNYFKAGEYDHNAVYIMGALVGKSTSDPVSLASARIAKIEHRAFPIDNYVKWQHGSKSLEISLAFKIIAQAQQTDGDWQAALVKEIPKSNVVNKHNHKKIKYLQ